MMTYDSQVKINHLSKNMEKVGNITFCLLSVPFQVAVIDSIYSRFQKQSHFTIVGEPLQPGNLGRVLGGSFDMSAACW